MIQFDLHIFQMGWFNHHLVIIIMIIIIIIITFECLDLFLYLEGPSGSRHDCLGAEACDLAFYFCHWLTDLAGAEPYPQAGKLQKRGLHLQVAWWYFSLIQDDTRWAYDRYKWSYNSLG